MPREDEEAQEGADDGVMAAFAGLEDPRRVAQCAYPLEEMLLVALCGVICGADDWVGVSQWGRLKLEWLRQFLPFSNGIASHDTFSRLFALLDAKRFQACLVDWMKGVCPLLEGQTVAIDGKSLRGSHDGDMPMAHMVSAWHVGAGVTLGQLKTATKSNEITAIPELIKALDLRGAVVTADAMACQREIFAAVVAAKADYIVAVKNNQPTLAQAVESQFSDVAAGKQEGRLQQDITIDKDHGRLETRCCVVATDLQAIAPQLKLWSGVRSVVMVESRREFINGRDKGKVTKEWRYYLSSLVLSAADFNQRIRAHWAIENQCHWVLDVGMREDACRVRCDHGAENLGVLRRIALNLVNLEHSVKGSKKSKLRRAAWHPDYLRDLLGLRTEPQAG